MTGRATFAPSSYIYAKCNVPARFAAGRDVEVRANIERTLWTNVQLGYAGWSGDAYESSYASFSSAGGNVRFAGRSDYLNPAWWRQANSYGDYYRNVVAQGIPVSLAVPAVSVSGFGSVCLSLGDYVAKYGYLGSLEFQAERKAEGGAWAQAGSPFVRNLTGSPEWHDVNTPLKQDLYYRLGCRRPGAGTGFFFIDDLVVGPVRSEGSALVDEEPPQVEAFLVNGGVSPATVRYVSAELVAADNRTPADQLLVQFEVNGQKRYFDGSAWRTGDGWGPYRQAYDSLDLGQTSGLVKVTVRVKDIAGNVGTAVAQVDLRLDTGYAATGTVTVAGAAAGAYDGLSVLFVRSEKLTL
ncbi:MAG: hypothetical protein H5T97_12980, partial [Firmicutes bacterium]|nr:hypothetical protein [Bacillota bacterium]